MAEARFQSLVPFCELKDAHDAVIIALHTCLVERGFGCIGVGEKEDATDSRGKGEEILPENWNSTQDVYALRYRLSSASQVFLFKVVRLGQKLAVHMLATEDGSMYDITVSVKNFVENFQSQNADDIVSSFQNFDQLEELVNNEIVDKITGKQASASKDSSSTKRRSQERYDEDDPLRDPPRPRHNFWPAGDPMGVGQGDRFPGNPGGSGMLMDPFRSGGGGLPDPGRPHYGPHPGHLPRGAVPPGARFDPFGPIPPDGARPDPRSGRFGRIDPDHMPPPGFDDDMFM